MVGIVAEISYFRGKHAFKFVKVFQYILSVFVFKYLICIEDPCHLMYLVPLTTAFSLLERPESVTALLSVFCKLLASQMGFCLALDPRDSCVCILILTQWTEIIFIVFFLREGSEMGGVECF